MRANPNSLLRMANPPIASRLLMFEDEDLRTQIISDLIMDIALDGLDTTGIDVGHQFCGRYHPVEDRLINATGSVTILSVNYNEEYVGTLYYVPAGGTHNHRFGPARSMFALLDLIRGEDGYHNHKYNRD